MSEIVENVCEQNSAQSKAAVPPTESANVEAVPDAVEADSSAAVGAGSKEPAEISISPKVDNKKSPVKRTPSKRMSFIERAQKESEELVKNMGGTLEIEGGRRTRSSTRGTPTRSAATATPPPIKKARTSPASGASTPTRPRGRGRKIDVTDDALEEEENKLTTNKKKTPVKSTKVTAKEISEETKEVEQKSEEKDGKVESAVSAESKDSSDIIEKPEEDKTDAALETVVEETQSQVAADSLRTEKNVTKEPENKIAVIEIDSEPSESVKSDSAMDTEDVKFVEEKTQAGAETLLVEKEPTPEPMEIDSSPKTDDVIEISEEKEGVKESIKNNKTALLNNIEHVAIPTPSADIVANNSIAKTAVVADANEVNTEETTPTANDLNKTENDLCEPKIATSPPISAANDNSGVTTPQTCN